MTVIVQVMYPHSQRFDWDYYVATHMSLVEQYLKPQRWSVMKGCEGVIPPDLQAIALMEFADQASWEQAFGQHSPMLLADIPKYTDAQPTIQVSTLVTASD